MCRRFAACPCCYARIPGAHAPGYEYAAASRLRRITQRGWRRSGNSCRRFAPRDGHLMPMVATTTCCRFAARADHLIGMATPRNTCRHLAACPYCYARVPGAHAPGYGYVAASRLRRITPRGWRRPGRFATTAGLLMFSVVIRRQRRRRDRYLAWGVSPRNETGRHPSSREAATDI
jgi:hypothetical protein